MTDYGHYPMLPSEIMREELEAEYWGAYDAINERSAGELDGLDDYGDYDERCSGVYGTFVEAPTYEPVCLDYRFPEEPCHF